MEIRAAAGALDQVLDAARKRTPGALRDDEPVQIESHRVADAPISSTAVPVLMTTGVWRSGPRVRRPESAASTLRQLQTLLLGIPYP